jgi:hypothetical protein
MNARSNLDAIAAIQAEEITDTVLCETELDLILTRGEVRFLPRRTVLGFYRMKEPSSVSTIDRNSAASSLSSASQPLIPELYCIGVITERISSEAGPKIAMIHEDTEEGIAMSSFRNGDSKSIRLQRLRNLATQGQDKESNRRGRVRVSSTLLWSYSTVITRFDRDRTSPARDYRVFSTNIGGYAEVR